MFLARQGNPLVNYLNELILKKYTGETMCRKTKQVIGMWYLYTRNFNYKSVPKIWQCQSLVRSTHINATRNLSLNIPLLARNIAKNQTKWPSVKKIDENELQLSKILLNNLDFFNTQFPKKHFFQICMVTLCLTARDQ